MNDEHRYEADGLGPVRLIAPSEIQVPNILTLRHEGVEIAFRRTSTKPLRPRKAKPADDGKRGSRVAPDFAPSADMLAWAASATPSVDAATETGAFVDFWLGVSGKDGVKLDWPATWRNRMRNAHKRNIDRGWRPRRAAAGPEGESAKAKWCREHGTTEAEYDKHERAGDQAWIDQVNRRGKIA